MYDSLSGRPYISLSVIYFQKMVLLSGQQKMVLLLKLEIFIFIYEMFVA